MSAQDRNPRDTYTQRLQARRAHLAALDRRHRLLGNVRLAVAVAAVIIAWLAFGQRLISAWWLAPPGAVFMILAVVHDRVLRLRGRAARGVNFYERGLCRLSDTWIGKGETGERFADPAHPYANDLDLFGRGGVFELLSTARTRSGEAILARWLLYPSSKDEVKSRQEAVDELRPRIDLREDLAVLGEDVRVGVHPEALARWGEGAPLLLSRRARLAATVSPVLLAVSAAAYFAFGLRELLVAALFLQCGVAWWLRRRTLLVIAAVEKPSRDLALLSAVLVRIERECFHTPHLKALRAWLDTEGHPPSQRIARLNHLVEMIDSRENVAVRIFGPLVLWTTQLAFAAERWRALTGPACRRWLDAAGEIEALASLAGYAYEHPEDPFPEFGEGFEGEGIAHPLIPAARAVRNDVRLGDDLRVLIVSGSNMSGKSTLLRTVGVNAVLAMAGAPVRARRLRLVPAAIGASIRIADSLQTGSSRFYAEITRLRQVVEMTGREWPVLFLLDELLHGTNSHDRLIGAEAVIRGLAERGAIGLVTTHDLALSRVVDALDGRATNVHFEDHLDNGKISFDYCLRPGVVRKSNAIELMRSVGLPV